MRRSTALLLAAAYMSIVSYGERSEEVRPAGCSGTGWPTATRPTAPSPRSTGTRCSRRAAARVHSYRLGLNNFADLTGEELSAWKPCAVKPDDDKDNEDLPHSVDWRKRGGVVALAEVI